jgi:phosphatidylglycerol:prolipoprotein diacylglycerol transferase
MIAFPDINPVALELGPIKIHWYGLMYLIGFGTAWTLGRIRARDPRRNWSAAAVDDLLFYIALGVIVGGRLGYVLFYDLGRFVDDPSLILRIWQGGMSFHGGLLGVMIAMWWFARTRGRRFLAVADFVAPLVPPGIALGRIGNFINGNLWGGPSDLPWAMVFPDPRAGGVARHPSQLYQALLEGVALFVIVWLYSRHPRPTMAVSGVFLGAYGVFRFAIEFIRVPDAHIGYLAFDWVTMGQVLSAPMIIAGSILVWLAYRFAASAETTPPTQPARSRGTRVKSARR